jgi:hypothetical protein
VAHFILTTGRVIDARCFRVGILDAAPKAPRRRALRSSIT